MNLITSYPPENSSGILSQTNLSDMTEHLLWPETIAGWDHHLAYVNVDIEIKIMQRCYWSDNNVITAGGDETSSLSLISTTVNIKRQKSAISPKPILPFIYPSIFSVFSMTKKETTKDLKKCLSWFFRYLIHSSGFSQKFGRNRFWKNNCDFIFHDYFCISEINYFRWVSKLLRTAKDFKATNGKVGCGFVFHLLCMIPHFLCCISAV